MIDLRWLRENPEAFDRALSRRGIPAAATELLALDKERRDTETKLQEIQQRRNELSRQIGEAKRQGNSEADALMAEVGTIKDDVKAGEDRIREISGKLEDQLAGYPNVLDDDVPDGADETANVVVRQVGQPRQSNFEFKDHDDIGARHGLRLDLGSKLSGARFAVLEGNVARLNRAIGQFMLDVQTMEHGYSEVDVPYMVRDHVLFGTAQLPKFEEDLFRTTTHDLWLIPTSEVPMTNLVAGEILDASSLPRRYTALTPCFRSEAGAAGRDTRGMIRMHQFHKVELVSITAEDQSNAEHERMTGCAEAILQKLELPYQVVVLSAGDTGFGARKTYDLEVWLPGQELFREISSCSNCGDFQARRMNARYREAGDKRTRFVHTLNGSGLAVGRALIAIIENYQEADGSITIPDALRPYIGGQEKLMPHD